MTVCPTLPRFAEDEDQGIPNTRRRKMHYCIEVTEEQMDLLMEAAERIGKRRLEPMAVAVSVDRDIIPMDEAHGIYENDLRETLGLRPWSELDEIERQAVGGFIAGQRTPHSSREILKDIQDEFIQDFPDYLEASGSGRSGGSLDS